MVAAVANHVAFKAGRFFKDIRHDASMQWAIVLAFMMTITCIFAFTYVDYDVESRRQAKIDECQSRGLTMGEDMEHCIGNDGIIRMRPYDAGR